MQQRAEEQLQLHLGDLVAQTHPLPSTKWHEVLGFVEFTILCQESLRSEGLGLLPDLGVHVHAMQQRDDVSVFWNDVTIQVDSSKEETKIINVFRRLFLSDELTCQWRGWCPWGPQWIFS